MNLDERYLQDAYNHDAVEPYEDIYVVMDYTNEIAEDFDDEYSAKLYFYKLLRNPEKLDIELGTINEKEFNANDWENCKKNFKKIKL